MNRPVLTHSTNSGKRGSTQRILVLGATSAIAREAAKIWASRGDSLFLVARRQSLLEATAQDLRVRGAAEVFLATSDLTDVTEHTSILRKAAEALGEFDTVLIAYGTLADQQACEADAATARQELHTNFVSAVSLLTDLANLMIPQQHGCIAVISSVAGDRGRPSNYLYGSAKGGLSLFLQGLRARLFRHGITVMTVKPGLVDTPMTAHLRKTLLFALPERVASDIVRGIDARKNVIYTPAFWLLVMTLIKGIPEAIFKRMKL